MSIVQAHDYYSTEVDKSDFTIQLISRPVDNKTALNRTRTVLCTDWQLIKTQVTVDAKCVFLRFCFPGHQPYRTNAAYTVQQCSFQQKNKKQMDNSDIDCK